MHSVMIEAKAGSFHDKDQEVWQVYIGAGPANSPNLWRNHHPPPPRKKKTKIQALSISQSTELAEWRLLAMCTLIYPPFFSFFRYPSKTIHITSG